MEFWDLIDEIRRERPQMTVLVATAYMEEAARFDMPGHVGDRLPHVLGRLDVPNRTEQACDDVESSRKREVHHARRMNRHAGDSRSRKQSGRWCA